MNLDFSSIILRALVYNSVALLTVSLLKLLSPKIFLIFLHYYSLINPAISNLVFTNNQKEHIFILILTQIKVNTTIKNTIYSIYFYKKTTLILYIGYSINPKNNLLKDELYFSINYCTLSISLITFSSDLAYKCPYVPKVI